ncbi:MAG: hypothetical protein HFJ42_05095 [Clostridia bacterium]|nr:hypothetical protein [Clostridia bacterium]
MNFNESQNLIRSRKSEDGRQNVENREIRSLELEVDKEYILQGTYRKIRPPTSDF